jgi:hypothetical protein
VRIARYLAFALGPFKAAHLWAVAAAVALAAAPAFSGELAPLAARLAQLRSEVETLSAQISERSQDAQDRTRSFTRQRQELELELLRERARVERLRAQLAQRRQEIAAQASDEQELSPLFDRSAARVRAYLTASLPFRTAERLAELDKIEEQVRTGLLRHPQALMRLWSLVEDELRMTRESGLYRQAIVLDGTERLADVARLGTVALYFQTSDQRSGYAVRDKGAWVYRELTDKRDRGQVGALFDAFKKQLRVGFFELPNALIVGRD